MFSKLFYIDATECFYEQLKNGDRLEISYEVTASSTNEVEIDFIITNPDGSTLHQVDKHRDAAFGFYGNWMTHVFNLYSWFHWNA